MHNPFQQLDERLNRIEGLLLNLSDRAINPEVPPVTDPDEWGPISLAVEVLGLAKPTIYANLDKIPNTKRHGRLYFNRRALLNYLASGQRKTSGELAEEMEAELTKRTR